MHYPITIPRQREHNEKHSQRTVQMTWITRNHWWETFALQPTRTRNLDSKILQKISAISQPNRCAQANKPPSEQIQREQTMTTAMRAANHKNLSTKCLNKARNSRTILKSPDSHWAIQSLWSLLPNCNQGLIIFKPNPITNGRSFGEITPRQTEAKLRGCA